MSALTFPSAVSLAAWQQIRRVGPLGAIVGLHIAFFYALQSGLLHQAAQALPKEVFASFITPDPAPQPAAPKPPTIPKTVPVVKKAVTRPPPVAPAINPTPSQQAITAPTATAKSIEPPAVAAPAAPAPSAPTAPTQPKVVSGIEYIQEPQADYPPIARKMGEEGTVIVHVLVNEKGRAERADIKKSSGSSRLDEAARKAVLRGLYKPYMEDGKAIAVTANIPITFNLNN
jgi:protein TonB